MADCPGIYHLAETGDGALARLRVPGGIMTAEQLRIVADLAARLGNGQIDLTNRANLQIRGLGLEDGAELTMALRSAGLLDGNIDADRYRNITASPLSHVDPTAAFDVTEFADALDAQISQAPWARKLSVKFSFVFDSGGDMDVRSVPHDVGFFADDQSAEFRLSLAGALTDYQVKRRECVRVGLWLAELAALDPAGNGRLHSLVENLGAARFLERSMGRQWLEGALLNAHGSSSCARAASIPMPGPRDERVNGLVSFGLGAPLQRLSVESCNALSFLAQEFGNGTAHLSPWSMVYLPNIAEKNIDELRLVAKAHGLLTEPEEGRLRIVACSGITGCHRAYADTKEDGWALTNSLATHGKALASNYTIHLSGCERGCAYSGKADLLLLADTDGNGYTAYSNAHVRDAGNKEQQAAGLCAKEIAPLAADLMRRG